MLPTKHEQWDLAFSISEGMYGVGREAQVPGLLGLRPKWSALAKTALHHGISHEELIGKVLDSALERYPHLKERHKEGQT